MVNPTNEFIIEFSMAETLEMICHTIFFIFFSNFIPEGVGVGGEK